MKTNKYLCFLIVSICLPSVWAGVVAKFDLNNIAGLTTVTDISGNNHDAVFNINTYNAGDDPFNPPLSSSVTLTDTRPNNSHKASLNNPASMDFNNAGANQWTLECWFKPSLALNAAYGTVVGVVTTGNKQLAIETFSDGKFYAKIYANGYWREAASTTTLQVGQWYHLAHVYKIEFVNNAASIVGGQKEYYL